MAEMTVVSGTIVLTSTKTDCYFFLLIIYLFILFDHPGVLGKEITN